MDASTKPRVECRSLTGGPYARAGQLWSPEFSEVPEDLLSDDARMDELDKDVHIEIKVDGRYVSGPRAGGADHTAAAQEKATQTIAELRGQVAQGADQVEALRVELAEQTAKAAELQASVVELTAQVAALKASAAAPTETPAPLPAKGDDAKASKSSSKG